MINMIVFGILILVTLTGCITRIPPDTTLQENEVSGLTEEEFQEEKEKIIEEWNQRRIVLKSPRKVKEFQVKELGISYHFESEKIFEEAGDYYLDCKVNKKELAAQVEINFDVIKEPVNAELIVEDEPHIKEHVEGKQPHPDGLIELIKEEPYRDIYYLPTEEIKPEVTTGDLEDKGIKEEISSYETSYGASAAGRAQNIELVSDHVDGSMLAPGEVFSINDTSGPYSADRGFQPAPIHGSEGIIEGIGGGVCQNSSTLYVAALLAGLDIVERYSHMYAVSYLPLGKDASISYETADLKFKNNLENHAYIQMQAEDGVLSSRIFGTEEKEVEVYSEVIKEISPPVEEIECPDLEEGEEKIKESGQYGYETITYIIINGEEEILSRDYYDPIEKVVKVPE